ncbi:MAG: tyrosine-protein phosphatase [Hyphomonadaceae bacterium]|nr:tyrosine-protein phosphatase [Hyphomonadaceae bacterium]
MKHILQTSALALALMTGACASQVEAPAEPAEAPAAPAEAAETAEPAPVEVETVSVTFDQEAGAYTLSWAASEAGAPVDILVATSPDGANAQSLAVDVTETSFTWTPGAEPAERHYFLVDPESGPAVIAATRLLPLEGGRNFRDLGGYQTEDGRTVKWGELYRSGVMNRLTEEDYAYLASLEIASVYDLRTSQERTSEPTQWAAGEIEYVTFADPEEDQDANPLVQVFSDPNATPEMVAAMMTELYSGILEQQAPAYRAMFDELANGEDAPMAFNCSAGKDRTGVGAALILSALGVPRETVVSDYALSEQLVDYAKEFELTGEEEVEEDSPYAFLRQLPPELVMPLMRSDPAYIEAVFADIEAEHGSVLAFIQTELDVTDAELASIRERLLD